MAVQTLRKHYIPNTAEASCSGKSHFNPHVIVEQSKQQPVMVESLAGPGNPFLQRPVATLEQPQVLFARVGDYWGPVFDLQALQVCMWAFFFSCIQVDNYQLFINSLLFIPVRGGAKYFLASLWFVQPRYSSLLRCTKVRSSPDS